MVVQKCHVEIHSLLSLFLSLLQQYVEYSLLKLSNSTCANCKVNKKPDDVKLCLQQDVAINITEPVSLQSTETKIDFSNFKHFHAGNALNYEYKE